MNNERNLSDGLDGKAKHTVGVLFKVVLSLNSSWLAVILCVGVARVSLLSAPSSALSLILVVAAGAAAFYSRRVFLSDSSTMAKDLLSSMGVMGSLYGNIWAFKILIAVLRVCMR